MPTYDYICICGHSLERIVEVSKRDSQECPFCGGELKRILGAPGIKFVGPGFYKNDYKRQENLNKDFKPDKEPDANSELRKKKGD